MNNFKGVIENIVNNVVDSKNMSRKVHATLTACDPPTFRVGKDLEVKGDFVITPKYRVFTSKDVGKSFVLQEDFGGQQYIYCYEAAPTGKNGVPYSWCGSIPSCDLVGKCSCGHEVHIFSGVLGHVIHKEGLD